MNYVMCECRGAVSYSTLYTIGTYRCEFSSKSVALRFMVKSFCEVGNSAVNNKPHNNIDDGSPTSLRGMKLLIKFNLENDCICIRL